MANYALSESLNPTEAKTMIIPHTYIAFQSKNQTEVIFHSPDTGIKG